MNNAISLISFTTMVGSKYPKDVRSVLISELNRCEKLIQLIADIEKTGTEVELTVEKTIIEDGSWCRWQLMLNTCDSGLLLYRLLGGLADLSDESW